MALIGTSPAAQALAQALQDAGTPVTAYPVPGQLLTALDGGVPAPGLLLAGPAPSHLRGPREIAEPPEAAVAAVTAALRLLQDDVAAPALAAVPLAWITAGAAGPGPATDLPAAATAGLIRSAQSEHPSRITHLDLDPEAPEAAADAAALAAALAAAEPLTAIRGGTLLAPRLTRAAAEAAEPAAAPNPDGTVLITGGTGTLGALIARHLAATGQARHLLLLSRRGPDAPGAGDLTADLEAAGAQAIITACDVTDRDRPRNRPRRHPRRPSADCGHPRRRRHQTTPPSPP